MIRAVCYKGVMGKSKVFPNFHVPFWVMSTFWPGSFELLEVSTGRMSYSEGSWALEQPFARLDLDQKAV